MIFAIGIFLSAKNKSSCNAQSANESQAVLEPVHNTSDVCRATANTAKWAFFYLHLLKHFILYVFTLHHKKKNAA